MLQASWTPAKVPVKARYRLFSLLLVVEVVPQADVDGHQVDGGGQVQALGLGDSCRTDRRRPSSSHLNI